MRHALSVWSGSARVGLDYSVCFCCQLMDKQRTDGLGNGKQHEGNMEVDSGDKHDKRTARYVQQRSSGVSTAACRGERLSLGTTASHSPIASPSGSCIWRVRKRHRGAVVWGDEVASRTRQAAKRAAGQAMFQRAYEWLASILSCSKARSFHVLLGERFAVLFC